MAPKDGVAGTAPPKKLSLSARVANLWLDVPVEELYYFALYISKYNME